MNLIDYQVSKKEKEKDDDEKRWDISYQPNNFLHFMPMMEIYWY